MHSVLVYCLEHHLTCFTCASITSASASASASVALGHKLTATPHAVRSACHGFSALQTIKQTNKHTCSATLHCNNLWYLLYIHRNASCITCFYDRVHMSVSCPIAYHNNNYKTRSKHVQKFSTHSPERVLSSPSCAARSSSSISYIFMSKDCFIHDADVFTLICAIPVLKTAQWTAFPRMHAHPKTLFPSARPRPSPYAEVWSFTALTGQKILSDTQADL